MVLGMHIFFASKACPSLTMQASENGVHSYWLKGEETKDEEGSPSDGRDGMYEESVGKRSHYMVCDQ